MIQAGKETFQVRFQYPAHFPALWGKPNVRVTRGNKDEQAPADTYLQPLCLRHIAASRCLSRYLSRQPRLNFGGS